MNLGPDDYLIHVDFSENYGCKYSREIQAVHFGGNRLQITLHTGVLYRGRNKEPHSFCTSSTNLRHDLVSILAHLEPILSKYIPPSAKSLHFLSDSPSSQYQNAAMFFIMKQKIIPRFPNLDNFTWNYSESSHGKGAVDGVTDVSNFDTFNKTVQDHVLVTVIPISADRDEKLGKTLQKQHTVKGEGISTEFETHFPSDVDQFFYYSTGCMQVHQVQWRWRNINVLEFNTRSCAERCEHYFLKEVTYSSMSTISKNISGEKFFRYSTRILTTIFYFQP